jgi:hypothetical protein
MQVVLRCHYIYLSSNQDVSIFIGDNLWEGYGLVLPTHLFDIGLGNWQLMRVGLQCIFAPNQLALQDLTDHVHVWVIMKFGLATLGNVEEGYSEAALKV